MLLEIEWRIMEAFMDIQFERPGCYVSIPYIAKRMGYKPIEIRIWVEGLHLQGMLGCTSPAIYPPHYIINTVQYFGSLLQWERPEYTV